MNNKVENAYAYYLSTYANLKPTRYDSHKKSELRRVYNHIVKSNKESPLYKLYNDNSAVRYAIDIKENAKTIQHVVASLSDHYGQFEDSFRKKVAVSSDENSVAVKYVGNGTEENAIDSFDIEVKRLSSPQVNVGNYLKNDERSFSTGSYSFDLNTNMSSYEFQFNVNDGETNLDILKKLANLVNKSSLGVTATIRNGTEKVGGMGSSALVLTSTQTGLAEGEKQLFEIIPDRSSASKSVMKTLGIDKITSLPQNSIFLLDGTEHSSLSNTFTLNDSFEITLKDVHKEDESATIGFKTNTDAVADNVMSLINSFNGILEITKTSNASSEDERNRLYNEMSLLSKVRRESLGNIGLIVADDGTISLDREKLTEAISPQRSEQTFTTLSRFKDTIGAKADNIAINPMKYVNKLLVAYKNPGRTFAAPYFSCVYSGIMLDRFV